MPAVDVVVGRERCEPASMKPTNTSFTIISPMLRGVDVMGEWAHECSLKMWWGKEGAANS